MLTIFNTNELRRGVEVAKLQGDILEYSPAAQELIKHIRRQELVSGYSCLIGGAEWCKLDFNALPCCQATSSISVFHLALQKWPNIMLTAVGTQSLRNMAIQHAHMWILRAFKRHRWTLIPPVSQAEIISLLFLHSSANNTGWTNHCKSHIFQRHHIHSF